MASICWRSSLRRRLRTQHLRNGSNLKKMYLRRFEILPRVNKDLLLGRSRRPSPAILDAREEGLVHTLQPSGANPARLAMPKLRVPSPAHMPIGNGNWRLRGEVCPRTSAITASVQGGRIAGNGRYDVTNTTFSTCLGPPSCSPPA